MGWMCGLSGGAPALKAQSPVLQNKTPANPSILLILLFLINYVLVILDALHFKSHFKKGC
jgi:hypothetical protein